MERPARPSAFPRIARERHDVETWRDVGTLIPHATNLPFAVRGLEDFVNLAVGNRHAARSADHSVGARGRHRRATWKQHSTQLRCRTRAALRQRGTPESTRTECGSTRRLCRADLCFARRLAVCATNPSQLPAPLIHCASYYSYLPLPPLRCSAAARCKTRQTPTVWFSRRLQRSVRTPAPTRVAASCSLPIPLRVGPYGARIVATAPGSRYALARQETHPRARGQIRAAREEDERP